MSIKSSHHNFKLPRELELEIKSYCAKNKIENLSEFYRYAINQTVKPDVEDNELVFSSLKQLHDKIQIVIQQQEILFSYMSHLARYFLSYEPEIPNEMKISAAESATTRFDKTFESFKNSIKNSPSMFQSLLADYFEEH